MHVHLSAPSFDIVDRIYPPSQQLQTMSAPYVEPAGVETPTPLAVSSSRGNLEERDFQLSHSLLLQDTNYTKDTVAASEHHVGGEKGWQGESEKPRHVGFWHRELNNVRLHVLKLWARTGKMDPNTPFDLGH